MDEISPKLQRGLKDYIEYYEKLSPRSVRLLEKIAEPSMQFKDPFNDVTGIEKVEAIFRHMFENTQKPKFKVLDSSWGTRDNTAYIRWHFSYQGNGQAKYIEGMSEVLFSKSGKVMAHTDFWDSGEYFYESIPMLGAAIRFVKSKLKV